MVMNYLSSIHTCIILQVYLELWVGVAEKFNKFWNTSGFDHFRYGRIVTCKECSTLCTVARVHDHKRVHDEVFLIKMMSLCTLDDPRLSNYTDSLVHNITGEIVHE